MPAGTSQATLSLTTNETAACRYSSATGTSYSAMGNTFASSSGGVHTAGGLILRQMRDQGLNAVFMSGDGIASNEFASIAGDGAEGTLMTFGPDPQKRPEAKAVIEAFEAREYKPEAYTLYSYAAVQILKQAIEATKSTDPKTVAAYMRTGVTFNTVIGDIAFDEKGDIKQVAYVMYTWTKQPDGRITYVQNE